MWNKLVQFCLFSLFFIGRNYTFCLINTFYRRDILDFEIPVVHIEVIDAILRIIQKVIGKSFKIHRSEDLSVWPIAYFSYPNYIVFFRAINDFKIVPRPWLQLLWLRKLTSHKLWNLFNINMLQKFWQRITTTYRYLVPSSFVEETFDDPPDCSKGPRSIAYYDTTKLLGIVISCNLSTFVN